MENPFRRAFPLTRLSRTWMSSPAKGRSLDRYRGRAESLPQFETATREVAATGLQAVQLVIDLLRLLVDRALLEPPFTQVVLEIVVFALQLSLLQQPGHGWRPQNCTASDTGAMPASAKRSL